MNNEVKVYGTFVNDDETGVLAHANQIDVGQLNIQGENVQEVLEELVDTKQDKLNQNTTLVTINGQEVKYGGYVTIEGTEGPQGATGAIGQQGPEGPAGIGIESIEQTVISTVSEGENVITVTKEDGTSSTFKVYNGARGEQGLRGETGLQGEPGPKGDSGHIFLEQGEAVVVEVVADLDTEDSPENPIQVLSAGMGKRLNEIKYRNCNNCNCNGSTK